MLEFWTHYSARILIDRNSARAQRAVVQHGRTPSNARRSAVQIRSARREHRHAWRICPNLGKFAGHRYIAHTLHRPSTRRKWQNGRVQRTLRQTRRQGILHEPQQGLLPEVWYSAIPIRRVWSVDLLLMQAANRRLATFTGRFHPRVNYRSRWRLFFARNALFLSVS